MFNKKYFCILTSQQLQAESRIQQGIFLYVIPVCIIVPRYYMISIVYIVVEASFFVVTYTNNLSY